MKRIVLTAAAAAFAVGGAMAADGAAPVVSLDDYRWIKRPVIVFADSPRDPRYAQQVAGFAEPDAAAGLAERDVVLILDTEETSPLREKFRPRGFQLILIGKDGGVKLRLPHPIEAEALNRHIDRMPMRREEMRGGQD